MSQESTSCNPRLRKRNDCMATPQRAVKARGLRAADAGAARRADRWRRGSETGRVRRVSVVEVKAPIFGCVAGCRFSLLAQISFVTCRAPEEVDLSGAGSSTTTRVATAPPAPSSTRPTRPNAGACRRARSLSDAHFPSRREDAQPTQPHVGRACARNRGACSFSITRCPDGDAARPDGPSLAGTRTRTIADALDCRIESFKIAVEPARFHRLGARDCRTGSRASRGGARLEQKPSFAVPPFGDAGASSACARSRRRSSRAPT